MPAVGKHAREKVATKKSDTSKERAVYADETHAANALVAMGGAEDESGKSHAKSCAVQQRNGLQLQVAAEDELFRESHHEAQCAPGGDLQAVGRRQCHEL